MAPDFARGLQRRLPPRLRHWLRDRFSRPSAAAQVPDRSLPGADHAPDTAALIDAYLTGGRVPWSPGYKPYRSRILQEVVRSPRVLHLFGHGRPLPEGFGLGLDERVVEYPWVLSRLGERPAVLLDAGSTLNHPYLLDLPHLMQRTIIIVTLAPEWMEKRPNVSYLFGDLRDLLLRDHAVDEIVCISTLEHIGLDNTKLYTIDHRFKEARPGDYERALAEFRRVLAPGGRCLLTVPFGRAVNLGWMQQFDEAGLTRIRAAFGDGPTSETFYRYLPHGWSLSDLDDCASCEYFDIHSADAAAPDGAAAARAVACLELSKPAA